MKKRMCILFLLIIIFLSGCSKVKEKEAENKTSPNAFEEGTKSIQSIGGME